MVTNVGTIDRALRIVIGLALIAYALKLGLPEHRLELGWLDRGRASVHGLYRQLPALQPAWREHLLAQVTSNPKAQQNAADQRLAS